MRRGRPRLLATAAATVARLRRLRETTICLTDAYARLYGAIADDRFAEQVASFIDAGGLFGRGQAGRLDDSPLAHVTNRIFDDDGHQIY